VKESRDEETPLDLISKNTDTEVQKSVGRLLNETSGHTLHPTEQKSNKKKAAIQLAALVDSLKGMEAIKSAQREDDLIHTKLTKKKRK